MRRIYGCLLQALPLVLVGCGEHDADDDTQHAPCSTSGALPDDPSGAAATGSPGASAGPGEPGTTTAGPGTSAADTTTSSGDSTAGSDAESASDGDTGDRPGDSGEPDETTGDGDTSGESTGGEGSGDTTTGGGSTGGDAGPSFVGEIWPIFSAACGCHKDNNGAGGLVLKKSNAFDNMVGEPSSQLPAMMLVEPGDPAKSYLWHKLNDTQKSVGGKGKKMPPGGLLKKDELALVMQWIEQGAAP